MRPRSSEGYASVSQKSSADCPDHRSSFVVALKERTAIAMSHQNFKTPAELPPKTWLARREALLADEKALTHQRERLNEARRALPTVEIAKESTFDTPEGRNHLPDLFEGRHQLLVYRFIFEPGDPPPDKPGEPSEAFIDVFSAQNRQTNLQTTHPILP